LPSQVPSKPQGGAAVQRLWGSEPPFEIGWQDPACPETLHDWQTPQLGAEQQTLSTQLPLSQSVPALQIWPRRRSPHDPPLHTLPGAQSLSWLQTAMQVVPLHANGAQLWVVAALQLPAPSQLRANEAVVAPTGQLGLTH
jgi:hypothetical protein